MDKNKIEAGRITNTHGVNGEVKIEVWLDSPEFMKKFKRLYFADGTDVIMRSSRVHKNFLLAAINGVDDINAAMTLKGKTVYIDAREARLPKGSFFIQQILGFRVVDEAGRELGVLAEVMESPASRIYVVRGETEHLIPAVEEFILSTDLEKECITVHLIEGM